MQIRRLSPYQFVILALLVLVFNCFKHQLLPKASIEAQLAWIEFRDADCAFARVASRVVQ